MTSLTPSLGPAQKVVLVGGTSGLGATFLDYFEKCADVESLSVLVRNLPETRMTKAQFFQADITDDAAIARAASEIGDNIDLVFVATGLLHGQNQHGEITPEKTWRSFDPQAAETVFAVNAIGPMLIAKHFLPLLSRNQKSVFAAISARVGSISDNGMGGWYSYRASKAALNQFLRSAAVELSRKNKGAICVGLHPGTVDTRLSKPFQSNVKPGKLFTSEFSMSAMLSVVDGLEASETGRLFAWDGSEIDP